MQGARGTVLHAPTIASPVPGHRHPVVRGRMIRSSGPGPEPGPWSPAVRWSPLESGRERIRRRSPTPPSAPAEGRLEPRRPWALSGQDGRGHSITSSVCGSATKLCAHGVHRSSGACSQASWLLVDAGRAAQALPGPRPAGRTPIADGSSTLSLKLHRPTCEVIDRDPAPDELRPATPATSAGLVAGPAPARAQQGGRSATADPSTTSVTVSRSTRVAWVGDMRRG